MDPKRTIDEAIALGKARRGLRLVVLTTEGPYSTEDDVSPMLADEVERLRAELERLKG